MPLKIITMLKVVLADICFDVSKFVKICSKYIFTGFYVHVSVGHIYWEWPLTRFYGDWEHIFYANKKNIVWANFFQNN